MQFLFDDMQPTLNFKKISFIAFSFSSTLNGFIFSYAEIAIITSSID